MILLWTLATMLAFQFIYNIDSLRQTNLSYIIITGIFVGFVAVFSIVAGVLVDMKFSKLKTVICSSSVIMFAVLIAIVVWMTFVGIKIRFSTTFFGILHCFSALLLITSYIIFVISSIRFGMDHFHDSSTNDIIVFIH